ncbi:MAG: selenide, water dikinase SelD [Gammaproteobacteria bacterium]|nr:selenide, water dikinase SelD [Gammaproteobacteria bacterium]
MNSQTANDTQVRLTEYSHGAGCGCKISPKLLDEMLSGSKTDFVDANLLVGNESKDDAAVYDLGNGEALISTTDFFMPIVDDPFTFGRIAGCNAISDIYAMGGKPLMAIAIFGWPIDKLPASVAAEVIEGGRSICAEAGIALAGGHSIDSPEPIFGLSVSGKVDINHLKKNSDAQVGDVIFLTKPLGVGILSTAQKMKKVSIDDHTNAIVQMTQLNSVGSEIATIKGVNAITDVTGFGLAGHLIEVCVASQVSAKLTLAKIPLLDNVEHYLDLGCVPGGSERNFQSYGHQLDKLNAMQKSIICDPQTSGGLLISVSQSAKGTVRKILENRQLSFAEIGEVCAVKTQDKVINFQ